MALAERFAEGPAGRGRDRWADAVRRLLLAAAGLLDGLSPPCHPGQQAELPPEWFKHPPI